MMVQEKRVQKYVETLDAIRAKNAAGTPRANGNGAANANGHAKARAPHLPPRPPPVSQRRNFQLQPAPAAAAAAAPPTQSWETFDLLSSVPSTSSAGVTTTMAAAPASPIPRFDWELF